MEKLTIALAKGRMGAKGMDLFRGTPFEITANPDSRRLFSRDESGRTTFIFVKPSDVVTYVERGVADLGVVGKDIILEEKRDIYELLDLGFGCCKFVLAGLKNRPVLKEDGLLRIASTYPSYVQSIFKNRGQRIEIIRLAGSVELAPLMGLSDVIVDLMETGNTLVENGLTILEELDRISGRLIANKVSYRFKYESIRRLERILEEKTR